MSNKELAILFHNIYEQLAPKYGYETREETRRFDENSSNGKLMIAVCGKVLAQLHNEKEITSLRQKNKWLKEELNMSGDWSARPHECMYQDELTKLSKEKRESLEAFRNVEKFFDRNIEMNPMKMVICISNIAKDQIEILEKK